MSQATELIARQMAAGSENARVWADILYNVKAYGAKGDWNGTTGTDDTASVQATIDTAIAAGGKAVFFPHGTYKVTALTNLSSVVLFGDNASFVGISTTINQIGSSTSNLAINVKDYGSKGDGLVNDAAAIQGAITAATTSGGIIFFQPGTYKISTALTAPSNVTLWFANGAKLSVDSGITVTINGPIEAGQYQIFSGLGSVVGNPKVDAISPVWFGAKDDTSDCSAAISKAIGFCPGAGGIVRFPVGGWWTVTNTINITKNSIKIEGLGMSGQTTISVPNQNFNIFNISGTGVEVAHLRILGDANNTAGYAINVTGNDSNIHDVALNSVFHGVFHSGGNIRMDNVTIINFKGVGITFRVVGSEVGMVSRVLMNNPEGQEPTAGVLMQYCSGIQFVQCEFMNTGIGVWMNPDGVSSNVFSTTFTDCYFDSCRDQGLLIQPTGANGAVVRTRIANCWFSGTSCGIDIRSGKVRGISLSTCDIYDNRGPGISLGVGADPQFLNIANSNIAGNTGSGISIESAVSNFVINGCVIGPTGDYLANAYGIYINTGVSNNYVITNNVIKGNTSAQLVDGGTGTSKVVANNITS